VLRSDVAGTDTTTWVVAREPAPPSGRLWHDRRDRPTSVLARTRPSVGERESFWQWVTDASGLDA
jgi:dehydrogenase/reductase SDR family member 12